MEVVKYGDGIRFMQGGCSYCGTTYKYTKHDIEISYGEWRRNGQLTSERDVNRVVKCPVCKSTTTLEVDEEYDW